MKSRLLAAFASLAVSAGVITAATSLAAPAHAEPNSFDYLSEQANSGLVGIDPATVADVAQSVCPLMSQQGQATADAAAKVADATGRSLGPAPMFTGLAISMYCPGVLSSLGEGKLPVEMPIVSSILGG